ncbi:hypothetical protein [Frigoriglobus tundricola]|uniref:Uncharacterized protein n=1 Tax=Frigoriglobus tundricola TaxID=2774151 RepID=A0A6M5Z6S7_9BACT|nr:hypothetical protein [Frigoriglobus tundricola]QJX01071.1 hypothetical protein FTUN_8710 [Frigoriglobus tundricola]
MWKSVPEMAKEATRVIDGAWQHASLSVGIEFQEESVRALAELATKLEEFKKHAQAKKDEDTANAAYGVCLYARGVLAFLSMWIDLKLNRLDTAWDSLIDAQNRVGCALRVQPNESFEGINRVLHFLEKAIFPPQLFTSSGHQFRGLKCNICDQEYGECDHVSGKLYMGVMCTRLVQEITEVDHVAIVPDPADKHLRLPVWFEGGVVRCSLTRRLAAQEDKPTQSESQIESASRNEDAPMSREAEPPQPSTETIWNAVLEAISHALGLAFATCGIELQGEAINKLADVEDRVEAFWKDARARNNEVEANTAFVFLAWLNGAAQFLWMWLCIKQDEMEKAWDALIEAQEHFECGLRFAENEGLEGVVEHLHILEHVMFPRQRFMSGGWIYDHAICTLCESVYGECDHIAGRLYMGQMCGKRPINIEVQHSSVVTHPHDKGCRIVALQDGPDFRCTLTRRVTEPVDPSVEHWQFQATILRVSRPRGIVRVEFVASEAEAT